MDTASERRLRTGLRTSAAAVTVPDDLPGRIERRMTVRRRQVAAPVAAATVAVVALGGRGGGRRLHQVGRGAARGRPVRRRRGPWEPLPEARSRPASSTPRCGPATR